jgi:hypothetical protein
MSAFSRLPSPIAGTLAAHLDGPGTGLVSEEDGLVV